MRKTYEKCVTNRISMFKEWIVLTRQFILIILNDKKNLVVSLVFPIVAAFIDVWIAGESMFVHYDGTKSACFVLVCAAIWCGLFNSIQSIVRERENIRRDYTAGMRISSYITSRVAVQIILCLVQSLFLCGGLVGITWRFGNKLPTEGLIFDTAYLDFYISLFLLMYAADAMGMFMSCLVRKAETANVMAPYILIVQLIFSGTLFKMKGVAEKISYIMLSRWGMEALGSISRLNEMQLKIQMSIPSVPHEVEDMFINTTEHLVRIWLMLVSFSIGFIILGDFALHNIMNDSR